MAVVETQQEADRLTRDETWGPYIAANGHLMVAPLRFPRDEEGHEREYRIGDEIRYESWRAWCAEECIHDGLGPLPDY